MNQNKLYNIKQIVSVTAFDSTPSKWYEYKEEKRFLGFVIREAGFYCSVFETFQFSDTPEFDNQIIRNNTVMNKPHVEIRFSDKSTHVKYFSIYSQALDYQQSITNKMTVLKF